MDENAQSTPKVWLNPCKQWSWILIKYAGAQKAVRAQVVFVCDWANCSFDSLAEGCCHSPLIQQLKKGRYLSCMTSSTLGTPPTPFLFPLCWVFTMEEKTHKTHRQKSKHVPAVWQAAGLCSSLRCQTLLPEMFTLKKSHQLGFSAETSYGAVLCSWVSCRNRVGEEILFASIA